jgi:hypothetical protein
VVLALPSYLPSAVGSKKATSRVRLAVAARFIIML